MRLAYIYGLADPDTGLIRYVGKSYRPRRRFRDHLLCKKRGHKTNWIRALQRRGQVPVLEIIDEAADIEALPLEAAYIEYFRGLGNPLVNETDGGEGISFYTAEIRRKMSIAHRGKRPSRTLETREKLSAALRGRPKSTQQRQQISAAKIWLGDAWQRVLVRGRLRSSISCTGKLDQ